MGLINPFDPWKSSFCSCPPKFSLSLYTGCSFRCLYCYASSYIKNFYNVRPKIDLLKRLNNEIKKLPKKAYITMANSSDPYVSLEYKLELTKKALKILKDYDLRINLITKSSLILRDLEILKDFKSIFVSITITTLNNNLAKRIEPFASPPFERLKTIERLSKYITVCARVDPLIYPLNTDEIKELISKLKEVGIKQVITSTYKAKLDNFKRMLKAFPEYKKLWERLYIFEGERISGYMYLPKQMRLNLIKEVRQIVSSCGLEFSSCREGFLELNTKICDGSSFLKD